MQKDSIFAKAYFDKVTNKTNYWEYAYEDSMNILAKLPHVACLIHNILYNIKDGSVSKERLDWGG